MAIVWALGAALSFGIADVFARESGRREGSFRAAFYMNFTGALVLLIALALGADVPWQRVFSPLGLAGVLLGLLSAVGVLLFYRALVLGPLMVVTPIVGSSAVVTVALALLAGERPGTVQLVGMAITVSGVVMAAATSHAEQTAEAQPIKWLSAGVAFALAAAVLFGSSLWLLDMVAAELGSFTTILILRIVGSSVLMIFLLARGTSPLVESVVSFKWLLPMALLDILATWSLTQGLQTGLTSVVSVIASLFAVVTVALGYVLYRERISRIQQVGVALVSV